MRFRPARAHFSIFTTVTAIAIGLAIVPAIGPAQAGPTAPTGPTGPTGPSKPVKVQVDALPITVVGNVNLSSIANAEHRAAVQRRRQGAPIPAPAANAAKAAKAAKARFRLVDPYVTRHRPKAKPTRFPQAAVSRLTTKNVPGESGFSALGGIQQATVSGFDLEPPDQGLCAGNGYVMEYINNALAIYDQGGDQLLAPISSASALDTPGGFFSDPRCYYDAPTKRWFFQELTLAAINSAGKVIRPSREYVAVSNTPDPTGSFTVFSWNTTDTSNPDCPCFGDYDNLGADANGIYVSTTEISLTSLAVPGVVIYAISKEQLENGLKIGALPTVFAYHLKTDATGAPTVVAPATTPPGARFATNTEYFVESNANAATDNKLLVYALHDTSFMASQFAAPSLFRAQVTSERYSFPANAAQRPGPRPLGASFQEPAGGLQADFDAEMEPVYAGGNLYAELDTATASGTDAVDWFILRPRLARKTLTASIAHQGTVAVKDASLLYPYTAVTSKGTGYLLFSLSGKHNYPSPAYIRYGANGPAGPVITATTGAGPDDSFGCYAAFVGPFNGGCRWGDYSMGAVMNGRVYMATELIPQGFRDTLTNWGTFIWSAPPPS